MDKALTERVGVMPVHHDETGMPRLPIGSAEDIMVLHDRQDRALCGSASSATVGTRRAQPNGYG
jgi:hypothetical protein